MEEIRAHEQRTSVMHLAPDQIANEISEVTRRAIVDHLSVANVSWSGRLQDDEFLSRLYDLSNLPSLDHRYTDAAGDIHQHCVRNNDWDSGWVFYDRRFNLMHAPDDEFLRFLCETLHPVARPSKDDVDVLVSFYNEILAPDGWQIVEGRTISAKPLFVAQSAKRAAVFEEPTGWLKVDRQLQEMRFRLDSAETEEQFQSVGFPLCHDSCPLF